MKTTHENISQLVQRWISRYYELLTKQPEVRGDQTSHLKYTNEINKEYLKDLNKHYRRELLTPHEGDEDQFKRQIDFLTGVYTREKKENEMQEIRNKLKAMPNRHYKSEMS